MALAINTNVASLNAQRALMRSNSALSTSFQRLSTGLRINSAKDDAAGLAIANRFTSQVRGLNQAIRNANDGISLAQTTEAALNEVGSSLQRLRELAVQASNDTNSASDRAAIQAEADQLVSEIDRVATQTTFNGRAVLDGSFNSRVFQIGANEGDTLSVSISSARSFNLGAVAEVTSGSVTATALGANELTINGVDIRASQAADDTVSASVNASSAIAKAAAINASAAETGVTAEVNANTYTGTAAVVADGDGGTFDINGVTISVAAIQADDADSALRNAINAVSSQTGVTASLDGSNQLVLTAEDGRNIDFTNNTGGALSGLADGATANTYGTFTLKSDSAINVAGTTPANAGLTAGTTNVNAAINLDTLSLASQSQASDAIGTLDDAIRQVSSQQADLGAILSRFESTVSSLSAVSENLSAARSRIQDADFAAETAEFSRNQILQQASTSILAQANVSTQVALSLLG
jgi:flagellin